MPFAPGAAVRRVLHPFRVRSFALLWGANLVSNIGAWMQQVAEPWLLLGLGASPALVGLDAFAIDAPVWLLVLAGGALADRADRRRTALAFQGIQLLCPLTLVVLLVTGRLHPAMVVALSFVIGITDALSMPSVQALVPATVPPAEVPRAVALSSAQFNLSRVLGPLLAGVTIAAWGVTGCFAINALTYLPFLAGLWLVRLPPRPPTAPGEVRLTAALAEAARTPALRRALVTVVVTSVLCAPLITFLPVLVRDRLHLGSGALSAALAALGVGGLLGAAAVLPLRDDRQRQRLASAAATLLAGLMVAVALQQSYAALVALMFAAGICLVASNTAVSSILQASTVDGMRGRVVSLFMLAVRGGAPLGNLATGFVVTRTGVAGALLANGLLAVALQLVLIASGRARSRPASG